MVKRTKKDDPRPADLNLDQMQSAIPKLERRINELKEIDVGTVQKKYEPRFDSLTNKLNDTLRDVFGADTIEYNQYEVWDLDTSGAHMNQETPLYEVHEGIKDGIDRELSKLETIIELFKEKLGDVGETQSGKALKALGDLELHPEIERAATSLFENGHYANAVEDACKALNIFVKLRSGRDDLDGTELMQNIFSPKNPILKFNELQTESEKSEQQGMMFLFAGAMLALRNPRAHDLIIDDPEQALEQISFISFLAKSIERTKR
jgi:uncharacterized protein (TIGR02391 family)